MLELRSVGKIYPDGTTALAGLCLRVERGEIVAMLGKSGCGKTTALRIMAGLERPSRGAAMFADRTIEAPVDAIGLVFQEPRLLPWLDVADNVAFGLSKTPRGEGRRKALDLLREVDLPDHAPKLPKDLSGGQAQRVALARALAVEPQVLLLDEPFSALDAITREQLQSHVLDLQAAHGLTVVLVTHDIDEAAVLADRILVLGATPGIAPVEVSNPLPRPRDRDSLGFLQLRARLRAVLNGERETGALG